MLEKDIENLLANYPDEFFPGEGFKLINQQFTIEGRRICVRQLRTTQSAAKNNEHGKNESFCRVLLIYNVQKLMELPDL